MHGTFPLSQDSRRLIRLWRVVRDGMPSVGRYRRYIMAMVGPLAIIWFLTAAYLLVANDRFDSKMTLILPGSGVGGSMNVESIGQATANTASAFSSTTLSPTENYKRLLMSDLVLRNAADQAGEPADGFPAPSVKLIDQTNLIELRMPGGSPEQSQRRMEALRAAFLEELDNLREDEAAKRESADAARIGELESKVDDAQEALLAFQGETGLVSLDQFASRISVLDDLRGKERDRRTQLSETGATASRLASSLSISLTQARQALLLKADPVFQELLTRYAKTVGEVTQQGATLGGAHGTMEELDMERSELRDALASRGSGLSGLTKSKVLAFADLSVSEGRGRLMEMFVAQDGGRAGTAGALGEIRRQIAEQESDTEKLVEQASRLADLVRDLRVAEAVFSSALARLDTNKSDPFASYPLVQTLETPSLPRSRAAPSPVIALAGAMGASLLVIFGFLLLWLRQPLIRKILPNA
ncbi:hypothetical protein D6851_15140 [Altericroceibacterium spongiae]|uniref:Lipopolysaccharide biosynthesis protein n=1 Tax=Altericroceibacterium spongiae TaxID=2320269 RepID=A0A420EC97_9SPHN|nr:hypothetical protein [Altericroceibacterium spongiae]RKF18301.1 hypothetical protein D6851_15140 [Altericroceibacterium spongiae]